jgi:2'-5' RNA ligase
VEEKRIYLLAQFDQASNKKLALIYDRLVAVGLVGEQTKGIPYHITLGSFGLADQRQVIERAREVCFKTRGFKVNLSHIALFGLRVLFIAPAMNTQLLQLYNDLAPGETTSGYHHWVAHATLLIDHPDNIQRAIPIVAENFAPFEATIESVGVLEFPPAEVIAEFELST